MPFSLGEIATRIGAELRGDPEIRIDSPATIESADAGDITFISNRKFVKFLKTTKASAVIVLPGFESADKSLLIAKDPYLAFAQVMRMFYRCYPEYKPGVESTAVVDKSVSIPESCYIGHHAVIEAGVRIGEKTSILAGTFVGKDTEIGSNCVIFQNTTIRENIKIGNEVVIYPNCVIGSDGFGYVWDGEKHFKIPQSGNVIIEDNVEIGAGSTIDRATMGATIVGNGTIIDNLVQIAHNCVIGAGSVICAQVGLAGSTELGTRVTLAGQVGVAGHLKIGDNSIVEAQSGIPSDLPPKSIVFGTPAREVYLAHKIDAILSRLPDYVKRIKKLESYYKQK